MKIEIGILARTFGRARVNRPDKLRTHLHWDCVGSLMKSRILKLPEKVENSLLPTEHS